MDGELSWIGFARTRLDADESAHKKGTGRHADVSEYANALRQIKQDASIRNWMHKSTSHETHNLYVSTKSTLWSNDTFQRCCGTLWPRKMVRLIIHYHDFKNSNFSNLPCKLLKSGHGLQRPNLELWKFLAKTQRTDLLIKWMHLVGCFQGWSCCQMLWGRYD